MDLIVALKFGPWSLEPHRCLLTSSDIEKELDPLSYKLLSYFLACGNKITTRDELAEHVWGQRYVDDNAIYRAISELRKHLHHPDYTQPFIKTHHKKGYSFTARVSAHHQEPLLNEVINDLPINIELLEQSVRASEPARVAVKKSSMQRYVVAGFAFLLCIGVLAWGIFASQTMPTTQQAPLLTQAHGDDKLGDSIHNPSITWEPGAEYNPLISFDQTFFAYRNNLNGLDHSYVQRVSDQYKIQLTYRDKNIDVLSWQAQSHQLLAAVSDELSCDFVVFNIASFPDLIEPTVLIPCGRLLNNSAQLSANNQYLYYVKPIQRLIKTSIYRYDLASGSEIELIPPRDLYGEVLHFELSKDESKIALFTADFKTPMHVGLFNLESMSYQTLLNLEHNYYGFAMDWTLDDQELMIADQNNFYHINVHSLVVRKTELASNLNPYYLEYESSNSLLYTPFIERHAGLVQFTDLFSGTPTAGGIPIYQSDMHSYNPVVSKHSGIFFASNRTGTHELWQGGQGELKKISNLNDIDGVLGPIRESTSGDYVLFKQRERLKLIRLSDQELIEINELPDKVCRYYWSDNTIIYSLDTPDSSQIWQFDLVLRKHQLLAENGGRSLLVNELGKVFYIESNVLINIETNERLTLNLPSFDPNFSIMTAQYLYVHDAIQFIYRVNLLTGDVNKDSLVISPGEMTINQHNNSVIITKFTLADTSIKRMVW